MGCQRRTVVVVVRTDPAGMDLARKVVEDMEERRMELMEERRLRLEPRMAVADMKEHRKVLMAGPVHTAQE